MGTRRGRVATAVAFPQKRNPFRSTIEKRPSERMAFFDDSVESGILEIHHPEDTTGKKPVVSSASEDFLIQKRRHGFIMNGITGWNWNHFNGDRHVSNYFIIKFNKAIDRTGKTIYYT